MPESLRQPYLKGASQPVATVTRHSTILIMSAVVVWLLWGATSGNSFAAWILVIFAAAMIGFYVLLCFLATQGPLEKLVISIANALVVPSQWRHYVLLGAAIVPIATSLVHYIWFRGFSILEVLAAKDVLEAALIRQALSDMPNWLAYLRSFAINCLFPITLLLAIAMKLWRLTAVLIIFGMLYAVNMLQKSGPILIVLPSILYLIHRSKYFQALLLSTTAIIAVVFMSFLSNPHLQPSFIRGMITESPALTQTDLSSDAQASASSDSDSLSGAHNHAVSEQPSSDPGLDGIIPVIQGLYERVAYVPGRVVSQWTTLIPAEIPFGMGCGYRFLAPFLDCDFQNYALIIHDKLYPQYVARGLSGSVNAASMMVGYANFGILGVLAYALIQACIAWVILVLFRNSYYLILPINGIYLFFLSSSDLLTTLLSGGWALSILLFLMLARQKGEMTDTGAEVSYSPRAASSTT